MLNCERNWEIESAYTMKRILFVGNGRRNFDIEKQIAVFKYENPEFKVKKFRF